MPFIGEIAALTTSFCWAFTSIFFTEAGRLIGAMKVNSIRLLFAVVIYSAILLISTGHIWPEHMNDQQFYILALSGLIGLVVGDGFGFKALVMIGPRLTTLLWATAPIMVTLIAWIFLDETLNALDITGITLTLAGVAWVVSERKYDNGQPGQTQDPRILLRGIMYGLLAALGQGTSLVLSKQGMLYSGGTIDPLPASFVRMFCAMVLIWTFAGMRGKMLATLKGMRNSKAMILATGGSLFGPFLGVWLSLVAVARIEVGIASTLTCLTPLFIIPVVRFYYKEKVSLRALLGVLVAMTGVALLLMGDRLEALIH